VRIFIEFIQAMGTATKSNRFSVKIHCHSGISRFLS